MNDKIPIIEYSVEMEAEAVIKSFVTLLTPVVYSTEGWIKLLNHPIEEVDDDEIKANILKNTLGIQSLLIEIKKYINTKS